MIETDQQHYVHLWNGKRIHSGGRKGERVVGVRGLGMGLMVYYSRD